MKKPFDEELYKDIGINELIVLGIYLITEPPPPEEGAKSKKRAKSSSPINNGEKCTLERLIKESFNLFPAAFCFSQYPEWPDSRKLDRPLRTLRKRKLITGNPKTYFYLTKLGKKIAIETAKTFRQRKLFK